MRKYGVAALLILVSSVAYPQQKTQEEIDRDKRYQEEAAKANQDTSVHPGWKHTGTTGLNLSEVSFKDWAAGGENALSYTAYLSGNSTLTGMGTIWGNSYKFAFGQTRLAGQGLRKTDDEIYFESLFIYKVGVYVNPYAAGVFRSQFAAGYHYDGAIETQVSGFLDPAYLTQSVGVAYKPIPELTTRLGVALREVITSNYPVYADDPATLEIEKTRVTGGLESVSELAMTIAENISFVARLELFGPFRTLDRVIVRNDYGLVAKVNNYVTTNLTLNLINDVNVSARTQMKQALSLGLTYSLF